MLPMVRPLDFGLLDRPLGRFHDFLKSRLFTLTSMFLNKILGIRNSLVDFGDVLTRSVPAYSTRPKWAQTV